MLQVTRKRLQKAGLVNRVELFHGDASKLPFINETFDAVFMSFTLEHLLRGAGYTIQRKEMDNLFVLPLEIVVAIKKS